MAYGSGCLNGVRVHINYALKKNLCYSTFQYRMRGISSEGMIMCASTPDQVEIIQVPEGAAVGDRVKCLDFPGIFLPHFLLPFCGHTTVSKFQFR